MRRSLVTAALAFALLAPSPALAQDTATSTAGMATPSPSPQPHDYCDGTQGRVVITETVTPAVTTAREPAVYTVEVTGPVNRVFLRPGGYQWLSPTLKSTEGIYDSAQSRQIGPLGPGETQSVSWTLRPVGNTRVHWTGAVYCGPGAFHGDVFGRTPWSPGPHEVRPRLTLTAVRDAPRVYTFSGVASRPGQLLNLYRVNADGSQVLTSQGRAGEGTWKIRRTFLGSGRFGFVVRTGGDMANVPGESNTRPTVIH